MSRALDKNVKEALKSGDHGKFFNDIVAAIGQQKGALIEFEVLGPSHPLDGDTTLLEDENAIAIPKLRLVQAFLVAYRALKEHISKANTRSARETLQFTGILLLLDPEHLTAANIRKRTLKDEILNNRQDAAALLGAEKYFIDSLLSSRLNRHTKSPTLWNHRRWLAIQAQKSGLSWDIEQDLKDVIFVSGVRHPRNYYAWCHARMLVDATNLETDKMRRIVAEVENWCFSHHDDVSGWAFLDFLLEKRPDLAGCTFEKTIKLVRSFRWRNESVWYFLRGLAVSGKITWAETGEDLSSTADEIRKAATRDGLEGDTTVLDQTFQWIHSYGSKERES